MSNPMSLSAPMACLGSSGGNFGVLAVLSKPR